MLLRYCSWSQSEAALWTSNHRTRFIRLDLDSRTACCVSLILLSPPKYTLCFCFRLLGTAFGLGLDLWHRRCFFFDYVALSLFPANPLYYACLLSKGLSESNHSVSSSSNTIDPCSDVKHHELYTICRSSWRYKEYALDSVLTQTRSGPYKSKLPRLQPGRASTILVRLAVLHCNTTSLRGLIPCIMPE